MTTETWKKVPGYEDKYEVSTLGNVRSLDREVLCSGKIKGTYWSTKKGRQLRPGRNTPSGHVTVALGKGNSRCVHALVLLAFVGPPKKDQECRHLNGIANDNRLENLAWGTRSENLHDKVRLNEGRKLSWSQVVDIKTALKTPYRGIGHDLARKHEVSEASISAIKWGREYVSVVL